MPDSPQPAPDRTLEQLYRAFLERGDEAALQQWMRRCAPTLRRLARRLGATAEDAEDLVQETFVAAIDGGDRFEAGRPLLPWLKGILTFRAARLARADVRRRRHYHEHGRHTERHTPATAEAQSRHAELDRDVRDAIDDLPEHYREPLLQYLLAQRSPVEIADQLGVERATVRTRLHRGLRRLRDALRRWAAPLLLALFGRRAAAARIAAVALVVAGVFAWRTPQPPIEPSHASASAVTAAVPESPRRDPEPRPERSAAVLPTTHAVGTELAALTIVVHGPDGAPLSGVGVEVEPSAGVDPVSSRRMRVTDEHGIARFPDLSARPWLVRLDRGAEAELELRSTAATRHTFVLAATAPLHGLVVDVAGRPVAGAAVWLGRADGARGQEVARSNDDGRFELQCVPAGAMLAARDHRHSRSTFATAPQAPTSHERPLRLELGARGARLSVRVERADGRAVPDALVHVGSAPDAAPVHLAQGASPLRAPAVRGRTDEHGTFATPALAAEPLPVFVRAPGFAPTQVTATPRSGAFDSVVVRLADGAVLDGEVVDGAGRAVPFAEVAFRHAQPAGWCDLLADAHGRFRLDGVPTGDGELAVRAPGHVAAIVPCTLAADRPERVRLVLEAARSYSGTVRLGAIPPPPGTTLRAVWPPSALHPSHALAASDERGAFSFATGQAGQPTLQVRLPGEPLWRQVPARWRGRHAEIDLPDTFVARSHLRGRVCTDDGGAIAAARLYLQSPRGEWQEVGTTDGDGTFAIGPLRAGSWRVLAETTDRALPTIVSQPLELAADSTRTVELRAAPSGWLSVEVERTDGGPVGDVLMTVKRREPDRRFAIATAPRLRQRLEAGEYVVSVMGRQVEWLDERVVRVDAASETTVTLPLRPATNCTLELTGLPRQRDDELLLHLHDRFAPHDRAFATFSLLHDAPLRLGAVLPIGSYRLVCTPADGRPLFGDFDVAGAHDAARPIRVDLALR